MNLGKVFSNNIFIKGGITGETYEFKICAYKETNSGTEYGEQSNSQAITIKKVENNVERIIVGQAKNLNISNVTKNSVLIKWDNANNATGYEIYLAKGNGNFTYLTSITKTYADISGLDYNTNYTFKVLPYNDQKNDKIYASNFSTIKFTTAGSYEEEKLNQVKNLDIKVNKTSLTLSWDKVSNANGYNIYLAEGNGSFRYVKYSTGLTTTLNGLDYNKTYKVKVCAYKNVNGKEIEGEFSSTRTFTTEKDEIENIRGFNVEVKHRNEAYVSWWPIDDVDGYEIWAAEDGKTFKNIGSTTDSTYILYDLEYKTDYKVKVRAYKYKNGSQNYGEFSVAKYFSTERYDKYEDSPNVGNINYVNYYVNGGTVYLSWNEVSNADGYEIEFTVPGLGGATKIRTTTNSREISGLTDKKNRYTARVREYKIINGAYEYGQYSEIKKFTAK